MDNYDHEDGEYYEEDGEVEEHEGQALGYDDEEGEEAHQNEGESPFGGEPPVPEEQPLPEKKEWSGFVRLYLPSCLATKENPRPSLKPARVYFASNEVPEWTRYLVNDDVPYFEAVLKGNDVSDPEQEDEEDWNEEDEEGDAVDEEGEEDDEEGRGGDGEYNPEDDDGYGDDEHEDGGSRRSKKKNAKKGGKQRNGTSAANHGFDQGDASNGGLPVEFDEDGFLVIPQPFRGGARFALTQLLESHERDAEAGLPAIVLDENDNEMVFIARIIPKEEADADDLAFAEANGIVDPEEVPAVGPPKPLDLRSRIMIIPPPADEEDEEGEGGGYGGEDNEGGFDGAEGDDTVSGGNSRAASRYGHDDGESGALDSTGRPSKKGKGDENEGQQPPPLEFRMDALTLAALFSQEAFKKALMRREMPSTHFLEGWLEAFSVPAEGTDDQSTHELTTMVGNICSATTEAIEQKKNPAAPPEPRYDEDGNEMAPLIDAKHPPPPPTFVSLNEQGLISVPKLKMDLRWTFVLEKELPSLTSAMRHLRNRLLETARIAPAHPNVRELMTTPTLLMSYLEMLMAVPRSTLAAWIRPKPEEEEDDIEDLEAILIPADDEQQRLTPLSYMLGHVLLDLRTREAKKKRNKKELKLSAFVAHKPLLCRRFIERGTIYDPLLVPHYAPKAEGTPDANPYNATMNQSSPSPNSPVGGDSTLSPSSVAWPASLRLYDSDLVALACARYGALDTFREVLRIKNSIPRQFDDTVGTYHLLFHSFDSIERQCAICLVDFTAEEVKKIPLLVKRSIVPAVECIDDVFAVIDKDADYPSVFAAKYWKQLSADKGWLQAARTRCPSLYMRVDDEKVRFEVLLREITSQGQPVDGDYVLDKYRKGSSMQQRDVLSPTVMYQAALARNVSVIVALCSKGVTTVKKPSHHAEQPLISFLLDDDDRRKAERGCAPVAARTAEDILAGDEVVSDGILSILLALVEAGHSLQGALSAGRKSILAELAERYGRCGKYKQLMKLWANREHERNTDPSQKFGLLRYIPAAAETVSPVRTR